jgi:hypothetical protein
MRELGHDFASENSVFQDSLHSSLLPLSGTAQGWKEDLIRLITEQLTAVQ